MQQDLLLESYEYDLPQRCIAQHPADKRDESRLLVLDRKTSQIDHKHFRDIRKLINPGDLLIVNDTKVFPARLLGKKESGGKVEVFLLEFPQPVHPEKDLQDNKTVTTTALLRSSKRPRPGSKIIISNELSCTVVNLLEGGKAEIDLHYPTQENLVELFQKLGQVPLPPYIERKKGTTKEDLDRYQTVYANRPGAVAAPTAGLHFTQSLLEDLEQKGAGLATITLHVGYGTFAPVRTDHIQHHTIHQEYIHIGEQTAARVKRTKEKGGKIWAVGTTTVRALEFGARQNKLEKGFEGWCDLYITPGFRFQAIDRMITNFHLPRSSLLFLVSAFCGRERLLEAYREAIMRNYRFYSYGDAMVIL